MKKLKKHIKKSHFVKVYLAEKGDYLKHFEGVIFDENEDFICMNTLLDFNYDGFVVIRKEDISKIKRGNNEKFFNKILRKENYLKTPQKRHRQLNFRLGTFIDMFEQLKEKDLSVIIENVYEDDYSFHIGPVVKSRKKKVKIDFIDADGTYQEELTAIRHKEISFFRIDSPYANLFYAYAFKKAKIEVKKDKKPSNKVKAKKDKNVKTISALKTKTKKVKVKKQPIVQAELLEVKPKKKKIVKTKKVESRATLVSEISPEVPAQKSTKESIEPEKKSKGNLNLLKKKKNVRKLIRVI